MFREMRRINQKLSLEECIETLKNEPRGILSMFGEDGYPYGIPMNYIYDEVENKLFFHCAKVGHKIDALKENNKVSFCVYDKGFIKDGEWALNIKSVVIFGKIQFVNDPKIVEERVREVGLKFYPTREEVEQIIKRTIERVQVLELSIDHISGKIVKES